MSIKIVSGGQTGVDQGALEAAVQLGLSSALVLNVAGPRESKSPGNVCEGEYGKELKY